MKILILSPRTPCEKGKADSMTVYYLIQFLHKKGHQIHLITFAPQTVYEADNLKELGEYCETVDVLPLNHLAAKWRVASRILNPKPMQVNYYASQKMRRKIAQVLADFEPDCVYAHLIRMAEYVRQIETPKMLAMQIAQTLNYARLVKYDTNIFRRLMYATEYKKIKYYEAQIARQFDRVLLISKFDKTAIDPDNQLNNVEFCPHGIDVDYYGEPLGLDKKPHSIVMNGDFGTPTNIQAATYFMKEIFPLILSKIEICQLTFAGRDSDKNLQQFAGKNITLTGRVEDIRPYLQEAQVAINPVKIAAGMQNKTLVSMAAGLPVVSTSIANEGIQAMPDEEILIADTPQQFADAVLRLFSGADLREKITKGGYQFVQEKWNLEVHHAKLEEVLKSMVNSLPILTE